MEKERNCCDPNVQNDQSSECCIEEVGLMMQKLVRVFQLIEKDQIKLLGFTYSQCYCMLELLKSDNLSMQELSGKMNLDTSTMTRIIDKLVRDGYIERDRDESDRRIVIARLTENGHEMAEKLNSNICSYYKQIIYNIPDGKVLEIVNSVSILLDTFEKIHPNCC